MPDPVQAVDAAVRLAEDVLFPAADEIDRSPIVPKRYLDLLADEGLYGLVGPAGAGGFDAAGPSAGRVVEALGGASLCTTFVWIQHHSVVRALSAADQAKRSAWLDRLITGRVRAGIAYAALRRPGPPAATARPDQNGGWVLDGYAPWVTGWGLIDVILAGARAGDDLVWLLIDASESPTCRAERVSLAALDASATVRLTWKSHPVPPSRVIAVEPFRDWIARDVHGRSLNGYLAVGVAARCARLLESAALLGQVGEARHALDELTPATAAVVRAAASVLAVRAAASLVAAGGGRSVETAQPAARLMREAMFLLVFGQTADIRAAQVRLLGS